MKILSISGHNLASLAEPFTVDLESGPLANAGLFTIHGPTGAGKSTLLDAVCLALYGETPRSETAGTTKVPSSRGEDWTAKDPRQIVRRGSNGAKASVRFALGEDHFVAEWAVTAVVQGRNAGNLNAPTMRIGKVTPASSAAPEWIHTGKDNCRKFMESRTGMNFENFCRSVLLAQGRFAALLEAKVADRARVLEALTDPSERYRRLSQEAFKRGNAAAAKFRQAQQEVDAIPVLAPEERAAKAAQIEADKQQIVSLKHQTESLTQALGQWDAIDNAQTLLGQAEDALGKAEAAEAALEAERLLVSEAQSVEPLREPRARVVAAATALTAAQTATEQARNHVTMQTSRREVAQAAADEAQRLQQAAAAQREQLTPELHKAREADHTLKLLESQRPAHVAALEEVAARRRKLEDAERADDVSRRGLRAQAEAIDAWMTAHPTARPLALGAATWQPILKGYISEELLLSSDRNSCDGAQSRLATAEKALVDAQAALTLAEQTSANARNTCLNAEEEARRLQALVSPEHLMQLGEQATRLDRLVADAGRLLEHQASEARERAHAAQAAAAAESAAVRVTEAELRLKDLKEHRATVAAQQALAHAQAGMAELRARLRSGEPCELCGSCDHPWADATALVPAATVNAEMARLDAAIEADEKQRDIARSQRDTAIAQADVASKLADRSAQEHARLMAQWRPEAAQVVTLEPSTTVESAREALLGTQASIRTELTALTTAAQAAKSARAAADGALKDRSLAEQQVTAKTALEAEARRDRDLAQASLTAAQATVESRLAQLDNHWRSAAPTLTEVPDAEQRFRSAAQATFASWTQSAEDYAKQEADRVAIATATEQLESAAQQRRSVQGELSRQEAPLQAALDAHDANIAAQKQLRAGLLGGRSVPEVETSLTTAQKQCEEARTAAESTLSAAAGALVAAETTLKHLQSDEQLNADTAEAARARYQEAAALLPFDAAEIERRISIAPEAIARCEQALAEASKTTKELGSARDAARKHHETLTAQGPTRDRDTLTTERQKLGEALSALEQKVGALQEALANDATAVQRRAEKELELAALMKSEGVWGRLSDAIGSREGDLFAVFAQSLAFESLLSAANSEIARLRPRYALQPLASSARTPTLEMLVQDTEFGGETRPLSTLSGGERFLISLSLALGLSSLSSHNKLLGTLFIDEGFGTLDPQTLADAVDALRTLQQRGTQVGIISHVPELAESTSANVVIERVSQGLSKVRVVSKAG